MTQNNTEQLPSYSVLSKVILRFTVSRFQAFIFTKNVCCKFHLQKNRWQTISYSKMQIRFGLRLLRCIFVFQPKRLKQKTKDEHVNKLSILAINVTCLHFYKTANNWQARKVYWCLLRNFYFMNNLRKTVVILEIYVSCFILEIGNPLTPISQILCMGYTFFYKQH